MKILLVFGTRPDSIKMAPVVKVLKNLPQFETRVCVTAQHRQMLDGVLGLFAIQPDYDLNLMTPGQDLTDVTARVLTEMRTVLTDFKPDLVLVHGDTTTAMAAALAAFYQRIKIGHVEAGLRTGDKFAPFPEEINRAFVGRIADLHFAPTTTAADNLRREEVTNDQIFITGNTVIDALLDVVRMIESQPAMQQQLAKRFEFLDPNKKLILVTGHRRENFGDGFESISAALATVAERGDCELVYPVHLNPNVQEPVNRILGGKKNLHLIEPLDYLPFVYLMNRATLLLTDSGGVQEEAPSLGKPVLVMRSTTERPEAVAAGTVKLVGVDRAVIVRELTRLLDEPAAYQTMSRAHNPYGDGQAATRIATAISKVFGVKD
ncbi:MAG: UDP-N-acetylglucosamine 2-epimerase (non-hydrolyzing) [Candidatus Pacebacteria bacterium]|nr:UDP-N-acetylglucosamine 2-epimerase (non-hydrolyzing) [Candidatus Paceibacterota bacterium]